MPETRRDLFKTSVLSALGGLAAGAIAAAAGGYAVLRATGSPRPLDLALANSIAAVYDQKSTCWYFFVFGPPPPPPPLTCTVWNTGKGVAFPSIGPAVGTGPASPSASNAVDTNSWFQSLKGNSMVSTTPAGNLDIQYTNSAGGSGSITGTIGSGGSLSSLNSLLEALVDMQHYPASWNEIGKQ